MKVHSSNYQICGFTSSVSEEELAELGQRNECTRSNGFEAAAH